MIDGMITPLVTPFHRNEEQSINFEAAEQLVDHLIEKGIDGLFLLGSNGEAHVLDHDEKIAFAEHMIAYVNERIPVYVGTGACSTREAVCLSVEMEKIGADAVSVLAPYFFQPTEDELYSYFEAISKRIHIPIILYNIPKTVGYNLSKELVGRVAILPNVKGIKDSSGDLKLVEEYLDVAADTNVHVLMGSDSKITQGYQLGAKGAVAGTSNLLTDTLVGLHRSLIEGKDQKAALYQQEIEYLRNILKYGTVPSILKRSIELAGIAEVGPARYPVHDPSAERDKAIFEMLEKVGLRETGD